MRVTLQMSCNSSIYNISNTASELYSLQNQLASGYSVEKASDNPSAALTALQCESLINKAEIYESNITRADLFLGLSDTALASVNSVLTDTKSIASAAANGTYTEDMIDGYISEAISNLTSLVNAANSTSSGQYLFAGSNSNEEPFTIVNDKFVCYNGNLEEIKAMVDTQYSAAINITPDVAFGNLLTTIASDSLSRVLNISESNSTSLEDLNGGTGVNGTTLNIKYSSAYETGLNIDISEAENLADVARIIEDASVSRADSFETTDDEYNYVLQVSLNDEKDGLVITQYNRTAGVVVDLDTDTFATTITVDDTVAAVDLGIEGTGTTTGSSVLAGTDLNPAISEQTLLSDISNWDGNSFVIYNGDETDGNVISDVTGDPNYTSSWNLTGLSENVNVDEDGDVYYSLTDLGSGEWRVDIYNDPDMTENSRIATGATDGSKVVLESVNNSGVQGSVLISPPSSSAVPLTGELSITFDSTFSAGIDVTAFNESDGSLVGTSGTYSTGMTGNWSIQGLEDGVSTDVDGNLYVEIVKNSVTDYDVLLYSDAAHTDLVASGDLLDAAQGTVVLSGSANYPDVSGMVDLSIPSDAAVGTHTLTLNASFSTVEDYLNAINYSSTYTTAAISDDGMSLEISSQLSGAYLSVGQNYEMAYLEGDNNSQLSQMSLLGVVAGYNADDAGGLYTSVFINDDGLYQVNVYSDDEHENLVASGTSDTAYGVILLSEENNSNLSGSVYLEYSADDYDIEVSAKGRSTSNDSANQISNINLTGLENGITSDFTGKNYIEVVETTPGTYAVSLYSDEKHTSLVASGTITGNGTVTMNEANNSGVSGSLYLNYTEDDSDIVVNQNVSGLSGSKREENTFSAYTDLINALNTMDEEGIGDMVEVFADEIDRVVNARAIIGSRQDLFETINEQHETDILNYTNMRSEAIEVDYTTATVEYTAKQVTYEAALSTTAQVMSVSILNYL